MTTELKPYHLGLLWHSLDSENLGMGALTIGNTNLIANALAKHGRKPVLHIIGGLGRIDYADESPFESDFTNVGYKSLLTPGSDLHRTIQKCDIFFDIGGGDSFSDIYRLKRFALIIGSKFAAARTGKPLIFSPQTIGPFLTKKGRMAARASLRRAETVFARDVPSFEVLKGLGFEDRSRLTTDVAFALPFQKAADKKSRDLTQGPIKVGLNVSALLYRRDLQVGDKIALKLDYQNLTDRIITRLAEDPRFDVYLVPHVLSPELPNEDDHAVSIAVREKYPHLKLAPRFTGPCVAKSYIANLDLLIGARMHATIAAISSDTATFPLGYSRKFTGLFGTLGYPHLGDMTSEGEDVVMAKLEAVLADVPGATAAATAANARAQTILDSYRNYLDELFAKVFA
ncbi:polysaccharide pyruvyl transferase WcaK-like protein [Sphingomonas zeicaulis]|uniref:polysaccharide pyruvyl transferase family protein n=1 Tax=Sphingomonas zeicaulis TaxID=1632740 RepID=UPI003D1E6256